MALRQVAVKNEMYMSIHKHESQNQNFEFCGESLCQFHTCSKTVVIREKEFYTFPISIKMPII